MECDQTDMVYIYDPTHAISIIIHNIGTNFEKCYFPLSSVMAREDLTTYHLFEIP